MKIVFATEALPTTCEQSVFLAGPSPRSPDVKSWRDEALALFEMANFKGHVFTPEPKNNRWADSYDGQVDWEDAALEMADCILFWVPRDMKTLPAFTTNVEWGHWNNSGKVVFGAPGDDVERKNRYLRHYADKLKVPHFTTLHDTVAGAIAKVTPGAPREGGETQVPLHIWRTRSFQAWLKSQKDAGNRLDGAKVLWSFRVGPKKDIVFSWAVHVDVFVANENRHKVNEFVLSRSDIATVALIHRKPDLLDSHVVLVREFRSPARTLDGCVTELPGGSSFDDEEKTRSVAVHEVEEETGFKLAPSRLRGLGSRQVAGTFSAHHADLFTAEISEVELEWFTKQVNIVRGVEADSERTYAEVWTVRNLLTQRITDWATLGMLFKALTPT